MHKTVVLDKCDICSEMVPIVTGQHTCNKCLKMKENGLIFRCPCCTNNIYIKEKKDFCDNCEIIRKQLLQEVEGFYYKFTEKEVEKILRCYEPVKGYYIERRKRGRSNTIIIKKIIEGVEYNAYQKVWCSHSLSTFNNIII